MNAGLILPSCGTLLHYMSPEKYFSKVNRFLCTWSQARKQRQFFLGLHFIALLYNKQQRSPGAETAGVTWMLNKAVSQTRP